MIKPLHTNEIFLKPVSCLDFFIEKNREPGGVLPKVDSNSLVYEYIPCTAESDSAVYWHYWFMVMKAHTVLNSGFRIGVELLVLSSSLLLLMYLFCTTYFSVSRDTHIYWQPPPPSPIKFNSKIKFICFSIGFISPSFSNDSITKSNEDI